VQREASWSTVVGGCVDGGAEELEADGSLSYVHTERARLAGDDEMSRPFLRSIPVERSPKVSAYSNGAEPRRQVLPRGISSIPSGGVCVLETSMFERQAREPGDPSGLFIGRFIV
jgi:hypothetical protein